MTYKNDFPSSPLKAATYIKLAKVIMDSAPSTLDNDLRYLSDMEAREKELIALNEELVRP